jgi:hypothetical protein
VLQADKGNAPPAYDELSGICPAQSHHEVGVGGPIDTDQLVGAGDGLLGELNNIG